MAKSKKKTKKDEGQRVGAIKTLTEDLEKLKLTHASLVNRYKDLSKDYACATNSLTCVATLEKEHQMLKAQAEKRTNKFVTLQGTHMELEYAYERLAESHAALEIAHEVVLT